MHRGRPLPGTPAGHDVVRRRHGFSSGWNRFVPTQAFMSSRRNQMARPQRSGGLPAVKTICSSVRMRSTSCGWISGRAASCFERVRDEPVGLRTAADLVDLDGRRAAALARCSRRSRDR